MRLPKEELGLTTVPMRRWLYVGQDEGGSGSCWYEMDFSASEKGVKIAISERCLRGYIAGLRIKETSYKGEVKFKLEILLDGDCQYGIRAGLTTQFTRSVIQGLCAIESPDDLKDALYFAVRPGEQPKIVFCDVYLASGQKVKHDVDKNAIIPPLIEHLQSIVGDGGGSEEDGDHDADFPAPGRTSSHCDEPRSERPAGLANESQIAEIKRVAASVGMVTDDEPPLLDIAAVNALCAEQYPYCKTIEGLKTGDAIAFRKLLLEM